MSTHFSVTDGSSYIISPIVFSVQINSSIAFLLLDTSNMVNSVPEYNDFD